MAEEGTGRVITQRHAAEKMGVSDRWVRRLLERMKADGDEVVVHGLRRPAIEPGIDGQTQARAVEFLKQPEWHDFGPTFASEQLGKRHNIRRQGNGARLDGGGRAVEGAVAQARRGAFLAPAAEWMASWFSGILGRLARVYQ